MTAYLPSTGFLAREKSIFALADVSPPTAGISGCPLGNCCVAGKVCLSCDDRRKRTITQAALLGEVASWLRRCCLCRCFLRLVQAQRIAVREWQQMDFGYQPKYYEQKPSM